MALDAEDWEVFSRGSAIRRAGGAGFARNVCLAMGNWLARNAVPPAEAVAVLAEALTDQEPIVRGHAAWALGRIQSPDAGQLLRTRIEVDACRRGGITVTGALLTCNL